MPRYGRFTASFTNHHPSSSVSAHPCDVLPSSSTTVHRYRPERALKDTDARPCSRAIISRASASSGASPIANPPPGSSVIQNATGTD